MSAEEAAPEVTTSNGARSFCRRPQKTTKDDKNSKVPPLHGNFVGDSSAATITEKETRTEKEHEEVVLQDCNFMQPTNLLEKVGLRYRRLTITGLFLLYTVGTLWFLALPTFLVLEDDHAPQAVKREETAFSSKSAMTLLDETFVNRSSLLALEYYSQRQNTERHDTEPQVHQAASWLYEKLGDIPGVERYNATYSLPLLPQSSGFGEQEKRYNVWSIIRATGRGRSDETLVVTTRFVELFDFNTFCVHENKDIPINSSHVCVAYPSASFLLLEEIRYFQQLATWLGKDIVFAFLGGDPYDETKDGLSTIYSRQSNVSSRQRRDLDSYLGRDINIFYNDLRSPSTTYRERELGKRESSETAPVGPITAALDLTKQGGYLWDLYKVHTQGVNGRVTEIDLYMNTLQAFQHRLVSTSTRIAPNTEDGSATPLPTLRHRAFNYAVFLHLNSLHFTKVLSSLLHRVFSLASRYSLLAGSRTAGMRTAEDGRPLFCYTKTDIPDTSNYFSPPQFPRFYPGLGSHSRQIRTHISEAVSEALHLSDSMKSSCIRRFGEDQDDLVQQLTRIYVLKYLPWYARLHNLLIWVESYVQSIGGFLVGPENPGGRLTQQNVDSIGISIFQSQVFNDTSQYVSQHSNSNYRKMHLSLMMSIENWLRKVNVLEERLHAASRLHLLISSTEFVPEKELRMQSVLLHAPVALTLFLSIQRNSVVLYGVTWFSMVSVLHYIGYIFVRNTDIDSTSTTEKASEQMAQVLQHLVFVHFILMLGIALGLRMITDQLGKMWHLSDTYIVPELSNSATTYSSYKSSFPASKKPRSSDKLSAKLQASAENWEALRGEEQSQRLLDVDQKATFGTHAFVGREKRSLRLGLTFAACLTIVLAHGSIFLSNFTLIVFNGLYTIPLILCMFARTLRAPTSGILGTFTGVALCAMSSWLGIFILLQYVSTTYPSFVKELLHMVTGYKTSLLDALLPNEFGSPSVISLVTHAEWNWDALAKTTSSLGIEVAIFVEDLLQYHLATGSPGLPYLFLVVGPIVSYSCLSWIV